MGCKAKKVVKDKKIVSPKGFVADIWHVLSYHSISKLGEIIYLYQIEYINMRGDDFHFHSYTACRERRPCRSRNQVRSEVQPLPCHRMVPWVDFEGLGEIKGSTPRDRPRCDANTLPSVSGGCAGSEVQLCTQIYWHVKLFPCVRTHTYKHKQEFM